MHLLDWFRYSHSWVVGVKVICPGSHQNQSLYVLSPHVWSRWFKKLGLHLNDTLKSCFFQDFTAFKIISVILSRANPVDGQTAVSVGSHLVTAQAVNMACLTCVIGAGPQRRSHHIYNMLELTCLLKQQTWTNIMTGFSSHYSHKATDERHHENISTDNGKKT